MSADKKPPFHLEALDHVVLRVADIERSIGFYCDVIGCTVDRRRPEFNLVHLRAGASMIDLVGHEERTGAGDNIDHFCLQIAPFDEAALLAHLAERGVLTEPPIAPRYGAQGTGRSLYLQDPDGNRVELKESLQSA
ncbi:VOC family protein [Sphingomonas sp. TDK1]|uniref:VOC family protein n=1 Tax=Sphingomonas sp. TDK1 TaxID=453247 RepID=UPI0007D9C52F|nr:VOC family protein [Sphingomonas sp. TDK1]OAN63160.1 lactoylglutathione lyase [Sphingomonas sp. TDK1]